MVNSTNAMGEGRGWALDNTQMVFRMPLDNGLLACAEQTAAAAEAYGAVDSEGQPTQAATCERLASSTGQIIKNWQESHTLPVPHNDFDASMKRGIKFRPDGNRLLLLND